MNRDDIFDDDRAPGGDFAFNADVAAVFDDMISRSVPFYAEQQRMVVEMVKHYLPPGAHIYDLGCATGTSLINLARELDGGGRLIGYDSSGDMLKQARGRIAAEGLGERIELRAADLGRESGTLALDGAGAVLSCWTLQFIRPLQRESLVRRVYESLVDGGVLIVMEKVLSNSPVLNRDFIEFYYAFKSRSGYSKTEIHRKREALENVLVPYRIDENREMLRRNGFESVDSFFQWFNFAGFVCRKTGGDGPGSPDR